MDRKPVATEGPAYTMGFRNKWKADDHRRGPGSYNTSVSSPSAPAYSMGMRTKPKTQDTWQRGPGSYEVNDTKRGPSFSLGIRDLSKTNRSTGPGPGSYNVDNSTFTKASAPAYSMGGRCTSSSSTHGPGPGAYNISRNPKGGPSYSMSSRPTDAISGNSYGRSTMTSAPAFSFGTRSTNHVERTPGPGAYNTEIRSVGPAYSITSRGHRTKAEKDLNPGPGAYDIVSHARSGPAFTMAHKRRDSVT